MYDGTLNPNNDDHRHVRTPKFEAASMDAEVGQSLRSFKARASNSEHQKTATPKFRTQSAPPLDPKPHKPYAAYAVSPRPEPKVLKATGHPCPESAK